MTQYYKPEIIIPYMDGGVRKALVLNVTEDRQLSKSWIYKAIKKLVLRNFNQNVGRSWIDLHCVIRGELNKERKALTTTEHEQLDLFAAKLTKETMDAFESEGTTGVQEEATGEAGEQVRPVPDANGANH